MILNSPYISGSLTVTGNATIQGQLTVTGSLSGTASLASNSLLLEGTGSVGFATTASLLAVSSSQQQISASLLSLTASYNALSSSYTSLSASYNVASSSFSTRITSDSSSLSSRTTQIENVYATTGSNSFTGVQNFSNTCTPNSFTAGASLYTAGGLRVTQDTYFSSSVYIKGNVTVYGTQSVAYISSSQLDIGTNIITVNTATPSIRYGGLSVFDSGSTGLTGSIFWDSELNRWIYSNASGSGGGATYGGGMFISGPRNSQGIGCEQGTTACMLLVGQGGDHLTSSMIYHDSTVTCVPNAIVGGSTISGTTIYGSTAVCSPVGKFTTCLDLGGALTGTSATFSSSVTAISSNFTTTSNAYTTQGTLSWNDVRGIIIRAKTASVYDFAVYSAAESAMIVNPTGTNNVTFPSGNIGIGTNAPYGQLDSYTLCSTLCNELLIRTEGGFNGSVYPALTFGTGGQGSNIRQAQIRAIGDNSYSAALTFWTQVPGTSNPMCERLRITSGGNVGIGTNAPPVGLSIQGTTSDSVSIQLKQNAAGGRDYRITSRDDGSLRINDDTAGSERMRITSCGNVGIGTTSPDPYGFGYTSLTIRGGTYAGAAGMLHLITPTTDSNGQILGQINFNDGVNLGAAISSRRETSNTTSNIQFYTNNCTITEKMRITSGGNVWVGNDTDPYIEMANGGSTDVKSGIKWMVGGGRTYYGAIELATPSASNSYLSFSTMNSGTVAERLRITSTGNVGIGSTCPNAPLDVTSTLSSSSGIQQWSYNSAPTSYRLQLNTLVCSGLVRYSFDMLNAGAASNCVLVFDRGNVGIGAIPFEKLTVKGDANNWTGNFIGSSTSGQSLGLLVTAGTTTADHAFFVQNAASNTTLFRIAGNGVACFAFTVCAPCFATISDYRMKSNIRPIAGLSIIMNTKPYKFEYNYDCSTSFGMIAHELQDTLPEAVFGQKDGEEMQGVDYMKLLPITIKAIQEQQCTICSQASMINILKTCLGIA